MTDGCSLFASIDNEMKSEEAMIGAGELNIRDFTNRAGEVSYIVKSEILRKRYSYRRGISVN